MAQWGLLPHFFECIRAALIKGHVKLSVGKSEDAFARSVVVDKERHRKAALNRLIDVGFIFIRSE